MKEGSNSFYIQVYCQSGFSNCSEWQLFFVLRVPISAESTQRDCTKFNTLHSPVILANLSWSLFSAVILHYLHRETWNSNGPVNKSCQQSQGKGGRWNEPQCPFQACRGAAGYGGNSKGINGISCSVWQKDNWKNSVQAYTLMPVGKQISKQGPWKLSQLLLQLILQEGGNVQLKAIPVSLRNAALPDLQWLSCLAVPWGNPKIPRSEKQISKGFEKKMTRVLQHLHIHSVSSTGKLHNKQPDQTAKSSGTCVMYSWQIPEKISMCDLSSQKWSLWSGCPNTQNWEAGHIQKPTSRLFKQVLKILPRCKEIWTGSPNNQQLIQTTLLGK